MFDFDWKPSINTKKRKIENENENEHENDDMPNVTGHAGGSNSYIRSNETDIYFYANIDKKTIIELQKETQRVVDSIVTKARIAEQIGCEVTYPPIKLHISSFGGGIFAAFSYMDFMTQLKIKNPKIIFHTIIEGGSASAATLISVTGDKRYITEYGYMLVHQLASMHWGKYNELQDDMKNSAEFMDRIKQIYITHTTIPKASLNKILKHDLYWNAEKCLEYGLVDEVLK
jgi:ATP-dependent protease ClpP protease subunit